MKHHVYISISKEDRIARFLLDETSGVLTHQSNVKVSGRPASIATGPQNRFMYVARRNDLRIDSFHIKADTGELSELGSIQTPTDPCHMAMDRAGQYLLSAHYLGKRVMVHRVGKNGALIGNPIVDRETAIGAHCFQTDPTNRFAFVPHIDNRGGANTIFQFKFDEATGTITENAPSRIEQATGVGPRHFCMHPTQDKFYFSNEQGSSISTYAYDKLTGTLSIKQTLSNLPKGWSGQSKCSQIRLTPNGKFLYAPNRGHDTLAAYRVDPNTGMLECIGHTPTQEFPRAFDIDPDGNFLLSAGLVDGKLGIFKILEDGILEKIGEYSVGAEPMWVTILPGSL
jgi:6-phosphogluconolactonase